MNSRLLLPVLGVLLIGIAQGIAGPGKENDFGGKRVLFIGIDGCRPDALQKAMNDGIAPNLKTLSDQGTSSWRAIAGGNLNTPTQQPTISGPGWTSICTGVWMDVHNVNENAKPPYDKPEISGSYQLGKAPHFAKFLKEAFPKSHLSSICSWGWIEDYLVMPQVQYFDDHSKGVGKTYAERDSDVKDKAVALLSSKDPDVLFLHFDQIDGAGHGSGFNPENIAYLMAVRQLDGLIGEVVAAVKARPKASEERWLILLTTDHGGNVRSHGGQTPQERTIFMIAQGAGVKSGVISGVSPGHTAVPPTIFGYLGVPIDSKWGWVSAPFALEK